jgi:hypothetical protein
VGSGYVSFALEKFNGSKWCTLNDAEFETLFTLSNLESNIYGGFITGQYLIKLKTGDKLRLTNFGSTVFLGGVTGLVDEKPKYGASVILHSA